MSRLTRIGDLPIPMRIHEYLRRYRPNGARAGVPGGVNGGYPAPYPGRVIEVSPKGEASRHGGRWSAPLSRISVSLQSPPTRC